jgi:hypothetical protein
MMFQVFDIAYYAVTQLNTSKLATLSTIVLYIALYCTDY